MENQKIWHSIAHVINTEKLWELVNNVQLKVGSLISSSELKEVLLPSIWALMWAWFIGFGVYVLQRAKEEWWLLKAFEKINSEYPKK